MLLIILIVAVAAFAEAADILLSSVTRPGRRPSPRAHKGPRTNVSGDGSVSIAVVNLGGVMRRCLIVVFATCLLVGLMLPAIASANPWVVRNSDGNRMGKVKRTATRNCVVYDRAGRKCGGVRWNSTLKTYIAWKAYASDTGLRKYAHIDGPHMTDSYDWYIDSEGYPGVDGQALKRSGRWIVLTWTSNRVRGKVSARCPGWGAAGAVFVLSKAFN